MRVILSFLALFCGVLYLCKAQNARQLPSHADVYATVVATEQTAVDPVRVGLRARLPDGRIVEGPFWASSYQIGDHILFVAWRENDSSEWAIYGLSPVH